MVRATEWPVKNAIAIIIIISGFIFDIFDNGVIFVSYPHSLFTTQRKRFGQISFSSQFTFILCRLYLILIPFTNSFLFGSLALVIYLKTTCTFNLINFDSASLIPYYFLKTTIFSRQRVMTESEVTRRMVPIMYALSTPCTSSLGNGKKRLSHRLGGISSYSY